MLLFNFLKGIRHALIVFFILQAYQSYAQIFWVDEPAMAIENVKSVTAVIGDELYYANVNGVKKMNLTTGVQTVLSSPTFNFQISSFQYGLAATHNGKIYMGKHITTQRKWAVYDPDNASWTNLADPPGTNGSANGMAAQTENHFTYLYNTGGNVRLNIYDFDSGQWASYTNNTIQNNITCLFTQNNQILGLSNTNDVYQLDPITGAWTSFYDAPDSIPSDYTYYFPFGEYLVYIPSGSTPTRIKDPFSDLTLIGSSDPYYNFNNQYASAYWQWNNEFYVSAGGITKRVEWGCYTSASIEPAEEITQLYAFSPMEVEMNFIAANTFGLEPSYTYFVNNESYTSADAILPTWAGDPFEIAIEGSTGFCSWTTTATIQVKSESWQPVAALPNWTHSRSGAFAFGLDQFALIGCGTGYLSNNDEMEVAYMSQRTKKMWKFDYSTNTLIEAGEFPGSAVGFSTYTAVDNMGYIFGGADGTHYINECWSYDADSDAWQPIAAIPENYFLNQKGQVYEMNDNIYMIGFDELFEQAILYYNIITDSWSSISHVSNSATFFCDDSYCYNLGSNVFERIDPVTGIIDTLDFDFGLIDVYQISSIVRENEVWFLSGNADFHNQVMSLNDYSMRTGPDLDTPQRGRSDMITFSHESDLYVGFGTGGTGISTTYENHFGVKQDIPYHSRLIYRLKQNACHNSAYIYPKHNEISLGLPYPVVTHVEAELDNSYNYFLDGVHQPMINATTAPPIDSPGYHEVMMITENLTCADTFKVQVHAICQAVGDSISEFAGSGRTANNMWVLNGNWYFAAGYESLGSTSPPEDTWKYSPTSDTWTQLADFPGGSRNSGFNFTIGGKLYMLGGKTLSAPAAEFYGTSYDELYQFNPNTNTWSVHSHYPDGQIMNSNGWVYNNKAYIFGGQNLIYANMYSSYEYNPANNTWSTFPSYPGSHLVSASVVLRNDTAFVIGGFGYINNVNFRSLNTKIYAFVHSTNSWILYDKGPAYTEVIASNGGTIPKKCASIISGDHIYMIQSDNVYVYSFSTHQWSYIQKDEQVWAAASNPMRTYLDAAVVYNNLLYYVTEKFPDISTMSPQPGFLRKFDPDGICSSPIPVDATIVAADTSTCTGSILLSSQSQNPNYAYQWYLNDSPIIGESSATHLAQVSGVYRLDIESGEELISSEPVTLTIDLGPTLFMDSDSTFSSCGQPVTLNAGLIPDGQTISWYYNDEILPTQTGAEFETSDGGSYYAFIEDDSGNCSTTTGTWTFNTLPCNCPGDVNSDGQVDTNDLLVIITNFGCVGCEGNLDNNALVGIPDIQIFLSLELGPCTN